MRYCRNRKKKGQAMIYKMTCMKQTFVGADSEEEAHEKYDDDDYLVYGTDAPSCTESSEEEMHRFLKGW